MKNSWLIGIHALALVILSILALNTNGLGGGGDSITHFFISQLSWEQSSYFLDLWGKPVFTVLSSPFAQAGFIGVKLFNVLCGVLASLFSCLVAKELNKQWHWLILPIAFIAPAFYTYLFSGLTEPVSALLGIVAVWLCLSGRISVGFIAASFLPFARSEAQVFLLFFLIFGLLNRHHKKLPLLLTGHLIYALLALSIFGDALKAFDSPYDSQGSVYGSGDWFHYINSLQGMLGLPALILAGLGIVRFFKNWFTGVLNWRTEPWLVHAIFFALFGGHSLVWALGIYGSAGLERTLITVFPFLWIIILDGFLLLSDIWKVFSKRAVWVLPAIAFGIQTYTTIQSPLSKYYYYAHLTAGAEYTFFKEEVADYIHKNYPDAKLFVMDKPEMAVALGVNFMSDENRINWGVYPYASEVPEDVIWIYDSYYVPVQYGIPLKKIREDGKLKELKSFSGPEDWNYILFKRDQ